MKILVAKCFAALIAMSFASSAEAQQPRKLVGQLDEVRFECDRYDGDTDDPVLTTMNNHLAVISRIAPWRGFALRLNADCNANVFERMVSWDANKTIWDLRQYRPGQYVYQIGTGQFGYWHGSLWFRNNAGELVPPFFPIPSGPIDPHVSVARGGETNFFLNYVTRLVGVDKYIIDTEVRGFLPSNHEVFRWTSKDRVPVEWSKAVIGDKRFEDRLHVNSIQVLNDALVVGARDLDAVMLISLAEGKMLDAIRAPDWTFVNDPAGGFRKAHTPQITPRGTLLLFDNGWTREKPYPSRAVEYQLDFKAKTATLIWEHKATETYPNRNTMGSIMETPDGRRIIGWGALDQMRACRAEQMIQMYSILRDGKLLREVRMPCGWSSYAVRPDTPDQSAPYALADFMKP
ncbi:Arylsulfotransferase, bacteria [Rhabdaerophilaceae bacterium]